MKTKWFVDVYEGEIRVEIRYFDSLKEATLYGKSTEKRFFVGLEKAA